MNPARQLHDSSIRCHSSCTWAIEQHTVVDLAEKMASFAAAASAASVVVAFEREDAEVLGGGIEGK